MIRGENSLERLSAIMLLVYGDESLDGSQRRVCAVAGLIGTERMWKNLDRQWKALTNGVAFHAADCESDRGEYSPRPGDDPNRQHQANKALYKDLTILLAKSGIGGFASSQDLAAQRRAFPSPYTPPLYYQGFLDVIEAMRNAAKNRREIAEFTFDSRMESDFNATEIYNYLRQSGLYWEERLGNKLSFEFSSNNPRLQAADLFAYEAMKGLDNKIGPTKRVPRKSWLCLKKTRNFRIEVFGQKYFSDSKMQPQNLLMNLGIENSEYEEWHTRNGLPHCHTSFFKFLFACRSRMTEEQLSYLNEFRERLTDYL